MKNIFKKHKKTQKPKQVLSDKDYERLGRIIESIVTSGYASKKRILYLGFMRGVAYGIGIFIGGTLVVGVILSILIRFEDIPLIGPFAQKINNSIEKGVEAPISN